jgi:hypothetical protein
MHADKLKYKEITQLIIKREIKGERHKTKGKKNLSLSTPAFRLSPFAFRLISLIRVLCGSIVTLRLSNPNAN